MSLVSKMSQKVDVVESRFTYALDVLLPEVSLPYYDVPL